MNLELTRFLAELRASGAVTAAAAVVGRSGEIEWEGATGVKSRRRSGRVTTSSLFDLASLTKPMTATLALVLDDVDVLSLRATVGRALRRSGVAVHSALAPRRLGSLLRHRAGLAPWTPLADRCRTPSDALAVLVSSPDLVGAALSSYSDLGYILWGLIAVQATGRPLGSLMREFVARPLGLRSLSGPPGDVPAAVECRLDNEREIELAKEWRVEIHPRKAPTVGTIQDGNARFLGGPCGHAGLFGSARAMWRLASEWSAPGALLEPEAVERAVGGRGAYALGWRRRPPAAAGRSGVWYGHTGFTGGGVWFCPETAEVRVLLAHRSSVPVSLNEWRARFLELAS